MMRATAWIVPALALIVAAVLAVLLLPEGSAVRDVVLAAAAFAGLALPAFLLAWVLLAGAHLRRLEAVVLAGLVGIGLLALGGVLLNTTVFGLTRQSWLGLDVVFLLVAVAVLGRIPRPRLPGLATPPDRGDVALLGGAVVLVVASLVVAGYGVRQPSESFSALWLERLPTGAAQVGIQNHEEAGTTYRVDVSIDGQLAAQFQDVALADGEQWTAVVPTRVVAGARLEVSLFRADDPAVPYRSVTMIGPLGAAEAAPPASP